MDVVALGIEDERGPLCWRQAGEWWLTGFHADKPMCLLPFGFLVLAFFVSWLTLG